MPDKPGSAPESGRTVLFLSYSRADRARAQKLADALELAGFEVWWDALIEGGAQFAHTISEVLDLGAFALVFVAVSRTLLNRPAAELRA